MTKDRTQPTITMREGRSSQLRPSRIRPYSDTSRDRRPLTLPRCEDSEESPLRHLPGSAAQKRSSVDGLAAGVAPERAWASRRGPEVVPRDYSNRGEQPGRRLSPSARPFTVLGNWRVEGSRTGRDQEHCQDDGASKHQNLIS